MNLDFKNIETLEQRIKQLKIYTSKQEKEAMLHDDLTIQDIYNILSLNGPKPHNDLEALIFILKLVEMSVSDIVNRMYECSKCGVINEINIELDTLIDLELKNIDIPDGFPIGIYNTPEDIINNAGNLILKDYNLVQNVINDINENIIDFQITSKCRSCKTENFIIMNPQELISKTSLTGIYDEYFKLTYYSHNTISDIDNIYPFERELYLSLLKKQVEKDPVQNLGIK